MLNDKFKSRYDGIPFAVFSRNHTFSEKDYHTLSHNHREIEIVAILDGEARFYIDSDVIDAKKGDIVIVSPYMLHHTTFFANHHINHICLCFDLSLINDENIRISLENGSDTLCKCIESGDKVAEKMRECLINAYDAECLKKQGRELTVSGSLMIFFGLIIENGYIHQGKQNQRTGIFYKIQSIIEEHYAENLTSTKVADNLYVTSAHFCRIFKQNFGYCFQNYLCMYRIEKAKVLLKSTDLAVSEISEMTGFNSFSYFSKMFKAYTSLTPSEYRKTLT